MVTVVRGSNVALSSEEETVVVTVPGPAVLRSAMVVVDSSNASIRFYIDSRSFIDAVPAIMAFRGLVGLGVSNTPVLSSYMVDEPPRGYYVVLLNPPIPFKFSRYVRIAGIVYDNLELPDGTRLVGSEANVIYYEVVYDRVTVSGGQGSTQSGQQAQTSQPPPISLGGSYPSGYCSICF